MEKGGWGNRFSRINVIHDLRNVTSLEFNRVSKKCDILTYIRLYGRVIRNFLVTKFCKAMKMCKIAAPREV
jgi:hypothetical protein